MYKRQHIYSAILGDITQKSKRIGRGHGAGNKNGTRRSRLGLAQAGGALYSTAAMPLATWSMLPLLSAATQMRPLETA